MNTTASLCHGGEKSVQRGEKGEVDKRSLPSKQEKGKKKIREENGIGQMFELIKGYECSLPSKVSISYVLFLANPALLSFSLPFSLSSGGLVGGLQQNEKGRRERRKGENVGSRKRGVGGMG